MSRASLRTMLRWSVLCVGLWSVSGVVGCGGGAPGRNVGPVSKVTGKVTFKGAPVTQGTVFFTQPTGPNGGSAVIGADGTFTVANVNKGLPEGTYLVAIRPPEVEKQTDPNTSPMMVPVEMPDLPKKYHSETTSGLKAEIKGGENTVNFDLAP